MIGKTVSHYKVLEKLGGGGMGVVYKAEDTKLKRTVALKFLPPEWTRDEDAKARFMHEAQAASALDHNNICTIYEIGETDDGQLFIAMACYDGETIKKKIERGPLKIEEAIDLAMQIAQGLAKAHEKQIVHRDIKPANVIVTNDSVAKIVDFGLAKLAGRSMLTKEGTTLGTVAYMSPEQAQGAKVDHRADVWALGAVLYEMIAGRQPFAGDYEQAVIYSIMNEDAAPITGLRTGVPMELERIVTKALAKNPDERYQSTNEMLVDLRRIQKTISNPTELSQIAVPGTQHLKKTRFRFQVIGIILLVAMLGTYYLFDRYTTADEDRGLEPGRKMLAVLPFENLGAPEDEYFADGITEEIMSRLAAIEGLGIISRTSVIHYKRTQKNVTEIAEELNVGYILAGTIRWDRASESPSRVRVTPQLIRVSDDINLWSDRYDAILNDIFQVQSDIAKRVSEKLGIVLLEQQLRSLESRPTANLAAYDYYLRGIDYSNRGEELLSENHFLIATQMYERAIDLDSTFAVAYARLSIAHNLLYRYHFDRTDETLAKQRLAAKKALQLAPHLPEAHLAMGYYFRDQLDYDQALKQFEIVLQGKPNDFEAVAAIGVIQRHQGKWEQAVSNLSRAVELNPRIGSLSCTVGGICLAMRDYNDADRHHQRAALLSPDRACPYYCMAWIYLSRDDDTEKTRTFLNELSPNVGLEDSPPVNYPWVTIDLIDGKYEDALNRLASGSSEAYEFWFYYIPKSQLYAQTYGLLNQTNLEQVYYDSARSLLERKIRERPRDARLHSALGIAYAGLGRKQEAIQEGLFATELLPASKDLWLGTHRLKDLAHIYVMVDEYEQAIDQLEFLLSIPSYFSAPLFRMDPIWTPLRSHLRFQKLLQEEE